MKLQAHIRKGL